MIAAVLLSASLSAVKSFAGLPLENALQKAVAISPDVAQARQRVSENESLLAAARGLAAPELTANYNQSPQAGNDNNTVIQRFYTVGGQITLGDYLALSPAVRQASFTLSAAQYDLLDAERAERLKLVGQYTQRSKPPLPSICAPKTCPAHARICTQLRSVFVRATRRGWTSCVRKLRLRTRRRRSTGRRSI